MGRRLAYSTVRIEARHSGNRSLGTAFGYAHAVPGGVVPFLVSSRHVVEGSSEGRLFFTRAMGDDPALGPQVGQRIDLRVNQFHKGWTFHPDPTVDIAVLPYGKFQQVLASDGNRPFFLPLSKDSILTERETAALGYTEDVVFVGYPIGLYDDYNLLPLVRHGITATPPMVDYGGSPKILIDAPVFPGSSGSPVFLANSSTLAQPMNDPANRPTPIKLLGVVSSAYYNPQTPARPPESMKAATDPRGAPQHMIDIGIVIKTSQIVETIHTALKHHAIAPTPSW